MIKVENPAHPDGAKSIGSLYSDLNEMKEIALLNLSDSKDVPAFHQLVQQADGLIEAFRFDAPRRSSGSTARPCTP